MSPFEKSTRRGFLALLRIAPLAPSLPAFRLLPAFPPIAPEDPAQFLQVKPGRAASADEVIHAALQLIGVLAPGERAPEADREAVTFHLRGLMAERDRMPWLSCSQLAILLAKRIAPMYRPWLFPGPHVEILPR